MMGWPVAWKCPVAWRCGEESQHPTWPQVRHNLRWTQREPILRHSSQPFALGTTSRIVSRCEHSSLIEALLSLVSTNGVRFSFFGGVLRPLDRSGPVRRDVLSGLYMASRRARNYCFEVACATTRIPKLPGLIVGRGCGAALVGAGRGPSSAAERYTRPVASSSA